MPSSDSVLAVVKKHRVVRGLLRLRSAFRVRPSEWRLLLEMVGLLAQLAVLQRKLPLPKLMEHFSAAPTGEPHPPVRRTIRLLDVLLRLTYRRDFCMKRSLLLFHFLGRWGYDPVVHFGVKLDDGDLKGHAWVELDERPVAEGSDPYTSFRTTYSYRRDVPAQP